MARRRRHFLQMLLIPILGVAFLSAHANALGEFQVFGGEVDYPIGGSPKGVVTDDFNGDGLLDLAIANGQDSVTVLYGFADGTFGNSADYLVGAMPQYIAKGDFNRDGCVDLAVTNERDDSVSVLYGQAGGGFGGRADHYVGAAPLQIVTGDFNDDGWLDLAILHARISPSNLALGDVITVLYGQVGGVFGGKTDYATGVALKGIVAGDFDKDGIADLAVVSAARDYSWDGCLSILYGRGEGGWRETKEYRVSRAPLGVLSVFQGIVAGDFNNDGRLDLAIEGWLGIDVIYGQATGGLGGLKGYEGGMNLFSISADFNADGKLDIASAGTIVYGAAKGGFANQDTFGPSSTSFVSFGVAAGDFNYDGRLDLAVARSNGSVAIIYALPDARKEYKVNAKPHFITAADFDGDGRVDVAFTHQNAGRVTVLYALAAGGFGKRRNYGVGRKPHGIIAADFDGDGNLDLAVANRGDHDVSVLYGRPGGRFGGRRDYQVNKGRYVEGPYGVAAVDFNCDGTLDLAVTTGDGGVTVLCGSAGRRFGEKERKQGSTSFGIATADFNNDGRRDLAVINTSYYVVPGPGGPVFGTHYVTSILYCQSPGNFQGWLPELIISGSAIAAGDFNGDGAADLVFSGDLFSPVGRDGFVILYADPGGGFGVESTPDALKQYNLNSPGFGVTTADFNGDGRPDLVLTSPSGKTITVFLNSGSK